MNNGTRAFPPLHSHAYSAVLSPLSHPLFNAQCNKACETLYPPAYIAMPSLCCNPKNLYMIQYRCKTLHAPAYITDWMISFPKRASIQDSGVQASLHIPPLFLTLQLPFSPSTPQSLQHIVTPQIPCSIHIALDCMYYCIKEFILFNEFFACK